MSPRLLKQHLGKREPKSRGPRIVVDNTQLARASKSHDEAGGQILRARRKRNRKRVRETEVERRARVLAPIGGA